MALSQNDTGTAIDCTISDENGIIDLTGHTLLQLIIVKPDGVTLTKTATQHGAASAGTLRYITQAGDLSVKGAYELRGRVVFPSGSWTTQLERFNVA